MNKRDVLEIRRRFKKDLCTFTRLCGCYVDADKNKITTFNENFLNLEDEEFYKYLEIVKSMFKGQIGEKLGNNLLEMEFKDGEKYGPGTKTAQLLHLRANLEDYNTLDAFYDSVIDSYDYVGNYLILVFHDVYDVMTKTSDNNEIDESEDVYEYLICAICPVTLTLPGLGYREDENRIAPRIRDWVVGAPDTGFMYPVFTDRKEDRGHILFYSKDAKYPHCELAECGLACESKLTGAEKRKKFEDVIEQVVGEDLKEDVLMKFSAALWETQAKDGEIPEESKNIIDSELMKQILSATDIPETYIEEIGQMYEKTFGEGYPEGRWLFSKKYYRLELGRQQLENWKSLLISAAKELERTTGEESDLTKRIHAAVTR